MKIFMYTFTFFILLSSLSWATGVNLDNNGCVEDLSLFDNNLNGCKDTQTIPDDRICDWSKAGLRSEFCHPQMRIDIMDHYTDLTGQESYDIAVQNAINQANGNGAVVFFPPGTYQFNNPINLESGIVLKGSGADETNLIANLNGVGDFIVAQGTGGTVSSTLLSDAPKFQDFIEVSDGSLFQAGDYVKLDFDDADLVYNNGVSNPGTWGIGTVGQIVLVESKVGNRLNLYSPLRRTYTITDNTIAKKFDMIEKVGVECLSIEREDATSSQTSNILFKYAADSWVHAIESEYCNFAHITIDRSAFCQVSASYMHDAYDYGGGGKAYGVAIQAGSADLKVEDNVFEHLRHSILLQSGANGNVLAYNYSFDPEIESLFSSFTGDMVCHGNYPYLNLFESNIHHYGTIDNSHGDNGPHNTYFRNRATFQWGFRITDESESQNIVGYEIMEDNSLNYQIRDEVDFEHGNRIQDGNGQRIEAENTGFLPEMSYYFTEKPAFLSAYNLPTIGIPNEFGEGSIPAKDRHLNGQTVGSCLPYCPPILVLNQVDSILSGNYFAKQTISANATIEAGVNVTFCAGVNIELGEAFESAAAQNFEILIKTCPVP